MTKTEKILQQFTHDEQAMIHSGLLNTWQSIGGDIFQSMEGGQNKISRACLIEVVLDSNYFEQYGFYNRHKVENEQALIKKFRALDYDDQKRIARLTFLTGESY